VNHTAHYLRFGLLLCALVLGACGAPRAQLTLTDQSETLSGATVAAAAAPLLAHGAQVIVVIEERGTASAAGLTRALEAGALLRDGVIVPNAIAVYVSLEPRYSELRAGGDWSSALPAETLRALRLAQLNPALQTGAIETGVVLTLGALEAQIRARWWAWNSPTLIAICIGSVLALAGGIALHQPILVGARWIWAFTPIARRDVRRRYYQDIARARAQLQERTADARTAVAAFTPPDPWQQQMLLAADQDALALIDRSDADPALLTDLQALLMRYTHLRDAARTLSYTLGEQRDGAREVAIETRNRLAQVAGAFKAAAKPGRKPRLPPVSDAARAQLTALEAELGALAARHTAAINDPLPPTARIEQLGTVVKAYRQLGQAAGALWQTALPEHYAAQLHTHKRRSDHGGPSGSGAFSSSLPPETTARDSDSSYDPPDTSPGPSSDGGPW
jgi:hypothetical protein